MLCDNPDSQEIENGKSMEKNGMRKCFIIFEKMEKFWISNLVAYKNSILSSINVELFKNIY
jgi:hypothetical protein